MPKQPAPYCLARVFPLSEEGPAIRIPYQVLRHAMGKSGPVRIAGVEVTPTGDSVVVRGVNSRGQPLQSFLEVPRRAAILRQLAQVLTELADRAAEEEVVLRRRIAAVQGRLDDRMPK